MKYLLLIIIGFSLIACKKEEVTFYPQDYGNDIVTVFPLIDSPGSYWIYDWYEIDSLGNESSLSIQDTLYMIGDTIINGNTYFHYAGTQMGSPVQSHQYLRDSSGYIVTPSGTIRYSTNNFTDTLSVYENAFNNYKIFSMTKLSTSSITTPAGTYNVFDLQFHVSTMNGTSFTNCDSVWIRHEMYNVENGVEIMSQLAFMSQIQNECKYRERRLIYEYIAP